MIFSIKKLINFSRKKKVNVKFINKALLQPFEYAFVLVREVLFLHINFIKLSKGGKILKMVKLPHSLSWNFTPHVEGILDRSIHPGWNACLGFALEVETGISEL